MKKVLYILSGNLSTTPRAFQSLLMAQTMFHVDILGITRNKHWKEIDDFLVSKHALNYRVVSLSRKPFLPWFMATFFHKLSKIVYPLFPNSIRINAYASSKTMYLLNRESNMYRNKYDLILSHSYSSLYPASCLSTKLNIPFAFDIEDYHPGESCSPAEKKRREFLMQKLLPKAAYFSYASPLIGEHSIKLLRGDKIPPHILVNNCFPEKEFEFTENKQEKLEFVWFSQNIAAGRGLELVVPALYRFKDKVKLVLIGNLYQQFYQDFLSAYADMLQIQEPLPQLDLNRLVCRFDVGLAIELKSADFNRDICLTNKIFTYAQAGLYILATDTAAQVQFMKEHPALGQVSAQCHDGMEKAIASLLKNMDLIRKDKKNRFAFAKKLSWDIETEKLNGIWGKIVTRKIHEFF